ncbi:hypothetical protein H4582DRAFT_2112373 [Lactarius indigo]|nr:hypothetical protein H4582DRAFT_2112373 [Lactarius indigo]
MSIDSIHAVSNFEADSYYLGISNDPPVLLYHTGHDKYPFVEPTGLEAYCVFKLNKVGHQIRKLLAIQSIHYTSIDVTHFITYGDYEKEIGPVVIWIGAYPGSTTTDTTHNDNAIVNVCGPLTAALGIPIATSESSDAQGSVSFFFHKGRDRKGLVSNKVMGVTCHHVLHKTDQQHNTEYEFKGAGAPCKYFQKLLDDIKDCISCYETMVNLHEQQIKKLEEKEKSKEEEERLQNQQQKLADTQRAINDLKMFYTKVMADHGDSLLCNIGHIHYSPPLSFSVRDEEYTEDWGTFELNEDKWRGAFMGNVLDLGTEISPDKLTMMMYPSDNGQKALKVNGIVLKDLLIDPDLFDNNDEPCLIVLKDGNTTGLTVECATGMELFICNNDTGEKSIALAIYNYDKAPSVFSGFSAKGDLGSLIIDGLGCIVGLLIRGTSKRGLDRLDFTYATPIWWLWECIKAKYPHADLNHVTFNPT